MMISNGWWIKTQGIFVAVLMALLIGLTSAQAHECLNPYGEKNYQRALPLCEALAQQNDPLALFTLGEMYHNGYGVVLDHQKSFQYFKQAARAGHAGAQNNLGYYYYYGDVVAQDYKRAFVWFSLAAAAGFQAAGPFRDTAGMHLDKDQKIQAQAMATACQKSQFVMCD